MSKVINIVTVITKKLGIDETQSEARYYPNDRWFFVQESSESLLNTLSLIEKAIDEQNTVRPDNYECDHKWVKRTRREHSAEYCVRCNAMQNEERPVIQVRKIPAWQALNDNGTPVGYEEGTHFGNKYITEKITWWCDGTRSYEHYW
jgi:hypothetical protein